MEYPHYSQIYLLIHISNVFLQTVCHGLFIIDNNINVRTPNENITQTQISRTPTSSKMTISENVYNFQPKREEEDFLHTHTYVYMIHKHMYH